jgi:hypothetical protein
MAAIDTAGRKATVLTFLMISGLSCLGCAILGPGLAQIILATVNRGVISAAWGCVYIVAAETCITPLRSQALGINNQAARLAGVLAPGVPFLAARLRAPGLSFWVMGVIGVAASAAVLLLPETRGVPQADTIEQLEEIHSASACRAAGGAAGAAAAATHKGAAPTAHRQGGPRGGAGVADHCGRGESVVREEFWDDAYEEPDVERRPLVGRGAGGSGGGGGAGSRGTCVAPPAALGRRPSGLAAVWSSFSFSSGSSGDVLDVDAGAAPDAPSGRGRRGGGGQRGGGAAAARGAPHLREEAWVQLGSQGSSSARGTWVL